MEKNRLIIHNVMGIDAGKYECFAENTVGFNRKAVLLVIKGEKKCPITFYPCLSGPQLSGIFTYL